MSKDVDYTIISKPDYIKFDCPHCNEVCEIDVKGISDLFDHPTVECPHCKKDVDLGYWNYD